MSLNRSEHLLAFIAGCVVCACCLTAGWAADGDSPFTPVKVGTFQAEVRTTYTVADGLPSINIHSLAIAKNGDVYAGTGSGLVKFDKGQWTATSDYSGPVKLLAAHNANLIGTSETGLYLIEDGQPSLLAELPEVANGSDNQRCLLGGKKVLLGSTGGLFALKGDEFVPVKELNNLLGKETEIRQVAVARDGRMAVAAPGGLFVYDSDGGWRMVSPRQGTRSWAVRDVRGVAFDTRDRLWFASPQGVGVRDAEGWTLLTGYEGLPYNDFTTMAAGENGVVWFGTRRGAIRYDGTNWEYRMAPQWLPNDQVQSISVAVNGDAWIGTEKGLGQIERKPTTLAAKARYFEDEIDKYNRRTPYGYVMDSRMKNVNDKSEVTKHASDNDGLWTAMYGAGECFAYAATKDPKAKKRAKDVFEALRFLSQVTQGGSHPAPHGFPARTILPTSSANPNTVYSEERDRRLQKRSPQWKVLVPRWPTSEDGKWYWKTDTSSDELDGHYFMYAVYYDLVADTEAEKKRVRDVVAAVTDHLLAHDYQLVDHDGKPTRWARFGPSQLNNGDMLSQRGLNSLSILAFLKVAEHVTGDAKYSKAYHDLLYTHGYLGNIRAPKPQNGPGSGNQSDDEMAFMNYYNLLSYETDPKLRRIYMWTCYSHWRLEEPELNPLFNFIFAASFKKPNDGSMRFGRLRIPETCFAEAVDTLKRFPLDRVRWSFHNSHRIDVVPLGAHISRSRGKGHRRNGKVFPIDERSVEHWNLDPWRLDEQHSGNTLTDGATFLLPYYMGLHHGFITE